MKRICVYSVSYCLLRPFDTISEEVQMIIECILKWSDRLVTMYIAKPRKKKRNNTITPTSFSSPSPSLPSNFFSPLYHQKMSRTLKEQMGLHPDPHAPEHTMAGGNRLTKVVSRKQYDSQQAGLPTYHRRIAK